MCITALGVSSPNSQRHDYCVTRLMLFKHNILYIFMCDAMIPAGVDLRLRQS